MCNYTMRSATCLDYFGWRHPSSQRLQQKFRSYDCCINTTPFILLIREGLKNQKQSHHLISPKCKWIGDILLPDTQPTGVGTLAQAGAEYCTTPPTLSSCPGILVVTLYKVMTPVWQSCYPIEQTCYHPTSQSGHKNLPLQ